MTFYDDKKVLLTKKDTNVLKGSATMMIMAAHLSYILITYGFLSRFLKLVQKTGGGYGVLVFFFISGYGLTKSVYIRRIYWRARIKKVIFPSVCLLLLFSIMIQAVDGNVNPISIVKNLLGSAWFIDVIVLEYIFYSVVHRITNEHLQLAVIILMNVILAYLFELIGLDERWYNAMLLFPTGIFMARYEKEIIPIISKRIIGITSFMIFVILGVLASILKGMMVAALFKTIAGIGLAVAICSLLYKVCIHSSVLEYIGTRSLYYYIIHAELIILLNDLADDFTILIVCMIIILTIILSEICYRVFREKKN